MLIRSGSSSIIHFCDTTVLSNVCIGICIVNIHFTDLFLKYKIFKIKMYEVVVFVSIYESWFSTISLYICQNIHLTNILIKDKIFNIIFKIFLFKKIKSRLYFYKNQCFFTVKIKEINFIKHLGFFYSKPKQTYWPVCPSGNFAKKWLKIPK